jgi:hypothetical protein
LKLESTLDGHLKIPRLWPGNKANLPFNDMPAYPGQPGWTFNETGPFKETIAKKGQRKACF